MLCNDLEGWDGKRGQRLGKEGMYIQLWLIHIVVWQKPTQHCKNKQTNKQKKKISAVIILKSEQNVLNKHFIVIRKIIRKCFSYFYSVEELLLNLCFVP